jgi:predicted unusual protein kinase regulating ubiquinone biosynthesis (AarF/ABC1/UbiB family)
MENVALARELFVGAAMQAITTNDDAIAQEWADKLERVARHMSAAEIAEAEQLVEAILRQQD